MSKVTEAMSQLGGSEITFAISVVEAYACIFALVQSLPLVRDLSRQAKSGFVSLLAVFAFLRFCVFAFLRFCVFAFGYLASTNI